MEIERKGVIRDINWLTAIDEPMLARLGGMDGPPAKLSDAVQIHRFNSGVAFQAGEFPRIGGINRGDIPAAYREVNELLRLLRFGGRQTPHIRVPRDLNAMQFSESWVR